MWAKIILVFFQTLFDLGFDVNDRVPSSESPVLCWATSQSLGLDKVSRLLKQGADPNLPDSAGTFPLHHVSKSQLLLLRSARFFFFCGQFPIKFLVEPTSFHEKGKTYFSVGKPFFGQKSCFRQKFGWKTRFSAKTVNFENYLADYHCI